MSPPHHVLIIGGHGKIAQLLTPLLLKQSWSVTSLVRSSEQTATIEKLAVGRPGKLETRVHSLDKVANEQQAAEILNDIKPDYIVWAAGAGGKGGPEMTSKIDRDAAICFIRAAASIPSISRFLLISYNGSRRAAAPWWSASEWDEYHKSVNQDLLANYYQAKIAADEELYLTCKKSPTLVGICLRPATLTLDPAGKIDLGTNGHVKGQVSRESVAKTVAALLEANGIKNCWLDLMDGNEDVHAAVKRCIQENVDSAKGENIYES